MEYLTPKLPPNISSHICISWYFSFLNRAGGSAGSLVRHPRASGIALDRRLNCSLSSASSSSCGWGAGLSSCLPFPLSSGFLPDPSPSSSGTPPPPGAPDTRLHFGEGRYPPPAPEASGVGFDAFPFPLTGHIMVCTIALSSEILPSRGCRASCCCNFSCVMRLRLISSFSSSNWCCRFSRMISLSGSRSR